MCPYVWTFFCIQPFAPKYLKGQYLAVDYVSQPRFATTLTKYPMLILSGKIENPDPRPRVSLPNDSAR
jgi:hypothetical protein